MAEMKQDTFFSIIIPVFNEASIIGSAINNHCRLNNVEIIVSDGGSEDNTVAIAKEFSGRYSNVIITFSPKGRGVQMNTGAQKALGEWLIFLHADTFLPDESFQVMVNHIADNQETHAGAFTLRLDHEGFFYRYMEFYAAWRCRLIKLPFGDHGFFIRRSVFEELGGFRSDFPVMEDVEMIHRLKRQYPLVMLDAPVFSSVRRFEKDGRWNRSLTNLLVQSCYFFGIHPRKLVQLYNKEI
ncbi:TIGR04283 family arsenosugar biosynthesis glycosyltransferase [bacterium]|nr:TIGR04283 family arsenosugar biosynthesis glycosyltransferase [bacterium]